ncbi:putative histone deacetylase [Trypanosoma conorhini]|uniref:Putative histone deacetylase n=1 Tax=Trypanosoma conorhini TaxID=83891 RepID=A0A422PA15_9TRYP|nr:putative histone deacetylase [Trypanosoma conorhini]RNF14554.1 putative histone deacetylase [Trypanosoma conorhini]
MPKRLRETAKRGAKAKEKRLPANGVSPAVAATCKVGLDAYIRRWMSEAAGARPPPPPSSLPPVTPLPTVLDVMMRGPPPLGAAAGDGNDATALAGRREEERGAPAVAGTGVVYDEVMLQHESTDPTDYERPGRLRRTLEHLRAVGLLQCCRRLPRHVARTKELRLVHSTAHIDSVDHLELAALLRSPGTSCSVGQDLYANANTSKAARTAAGCVMAAARSVVRGEVSNAFALVRPPGHHAGANNASGFCFFNNVGAAVRVAQQELRERGTPAPRALVLDWDVHHCDGTESIFYEDPSVVVVSIHQYGAGRGHVLRKTPTVFTDTIDLSALAALMEETTGEEANSNGGNASVGGGDDPRPQPLEGEEEQRRQQQQQQHEATAGEGDGETRASRRKPVDYVKLAADLGEDDAAIAMMFGIAPEELNKPSSSSSFSSVNSSGSGSSDSPPPSSAAPAAQKNLPGDTEGFSFDEEVDTTAHEKFYPGTGHLERVGGDTQVEARGKNINIPWPTVGMGDLEYVQVLLDVVAPVMREYAPHIVFISCGFDSAAGDLLGSMRLSPSGYYILTRALAALCPRLVVALEGGYHLSNVARCSEAVMRALLEAGGTAPLPRSRMLWCQAEELVQQVRRTHVGHWRCFADAT